MTGEPIQVAPGAEGDEAALLRRRAEQLARAPIPLRPAQDTLEAVEFTIGEQPCLLDTTYLREVRALKDVLPVPLASAPLLGLVQLRGRLLAVLQLGDQLGPAGEAPPPRHLLVLGRDEALFAVAAGEIQGLRQLSREDAQRRSQPLQGLRPEIVSGTTADGRLLLDGERLLAMQRPAAVAAVTNHHEP